MRLKGKFYKCLAMLYGVECWAVDKKIERRMSIAEMRMLRCGVTREDRIRNEYIRGTVGVASIKMDKIRDLDGLVMYEVRRFGCSNGIERGRKKRRGRPKKNRV